LRDLHTVSGVNAPVLLFTLMSMSSTLQIHVATMNMPSTVHKSFWCIKRTWVKVNLWEMKWWTSQTLLLIYLQTHCLTWNQV